ncbi:MAG TPA: glycosyltransferase 87 family protein [Candidatus Dormibacteraeota bacterium]|nr:glycosyltransferase 87 family protein [Candidatus Dormibacteraeota bacterium]
MHGYLLEATYGSRFDIEAYSIQAFAATHHLNVYDYTLRYPYPPVWIWIVGAVAELAPSVGLPFHVAIKLPATLADFAIVLLLFEYVRARRGWVPWTLVPCGLYALNPVPALIAAGHGQFDSMPVFFMLLAFHLQDRDRRHSLELAALSLGVGIALKAYPALLLPYLALTAPAGRKLWVFGIALVPVSVASAIYIAAEGYSPAMILHVIGYFSTADMGWTQLTSYVGLPRTVLVDLWLGSDLLILSFATLVPWLVYRNRTILGTAATFAFFYMVVFRASVQYLLWGLPFFCLVTTTGSAIFSLAGAGMLLAFYTTSDQGALPPSLPPALQDFLKAGYPVFAASVIGAGALLAAITLRYNSQATKRISAATST